MSITDKQWVRLPVYVQREIQELRNQVQSLRRDLMTEELDGAPTDTRMVLYSTGADQRTLPAGAPIEFGPSSTRRFEHGSIVCQWRDGHLDVRGVDCLTVEPRCANALRIRGLRR